MHAVRIAQRSAGIYWDVREGGGHLYNGYLYTVQQM